MGDSQKSYRRLGTYLIDLIFPPRCAGCGRLGQHWCDECQAAVLEISAPFCNICGLPLNDVQACPSCARHKFEFDQARSWAVYKGELRRAILSLKRKPNEPLAGVFALNLAAMIKREPWTPDLIVPIPLSADRLKLRGYNQAEMLAMPVGRELGIPITARGLSRPHSTRPQMNLHPAQRWENVRRAFQAEKASSSGANVLLIDDIITTGATMQAAAVALKEAGAKEVRALSLARALG